MALKQQIDLALLKNAITDILSVEIENSKSNEIETDDISQCLLLFQNFANYFISKLNQYEERANLEPSETDNLIFEITDGVSMEEDKSIEDETKSENEVTKGSLENQSEPEHQDLQTQKSDSFIENDLSSWMLRVKVANTKRAVSWKCIKCDFTAEFKGNVVFHVESHHTAMLYNCAHCEYETKTSRGLANHMSDNHGIKLKKKGRVYKAGKCITEIVKPPEVVCNDCGKEFILTNTSIKNQYRTHLAKHKIDKATCNCNEIFNSGREKENHMKVVHEGLLGCNECLNSFKSKKALERHKASHELMPCTECGIAYNGKMSLYGHMKRAHDTVEYMCDICSKVVRNNLLLREHKRKQHNVSA